jgi:hypothetical protein
LAIPALSPPASATPTKAPTMFNLTMSKPTSPAVVEILVRGGLSKSPFYDFRIGGNSIDVSSYEFVRGKHYRFVNDGARVSGHPFFISDQGRLPASNLTITSGGSFNTGIPEKGSLEFVLPPNFTGTLTYYCVHAPMTNTFNTSNAIMSTTNFNERAFN